jgi:type I restriction enzyme, S subunit
VKVGDMNSSSKYTTTAENYVDDVDLKALKAKVFPPNTLIFPKIGMAIYLNKYRLLKAWCTFDNNVAGIIPKKIEPEFLFYYFKECVDLKQISNRTTAPSIRKTALESLLMPLPRIEEQRRIVDVLVAVDSALEFADLVIAKTKRLKKGLMQQLLTRGIGHTKYQDTIIGSIPKTWQIVNFEDLTILVQNGLYISKGSNSFNAKMAGMTEIFKSEILNLENAHKVGITKNELEKHCLKEGDLLFARRSLKIEGSGKCVIVPQIDEPAVFESSIIRVTLRKDIAYPPFYVMFFNSPIGRKIMRRITRTVAVSGITSNDLRKLEIPVPEITEQKRIAEIVSVLDEKMTIDKKEKDITVKIKQELMDLLLTGKVRIKVD